MKNLKLSLLTFSFLFLLFSCSDKSEDPISIEESTNFQTEVLNAPEVVNFDAKAHGGELELDKMTIDDIYEGEEVIGNVITIPIESKTSEIKELLAYYDIPSKSFSFQVLGVVYADSFIKSARSMDYSIDTSKSEEQLAKEGVTFDADFNYYNLDGELAYQQIFNNNKMTINDTGRLTIEGQRAFCIFTCIVARMSTREKIACGFTVVNCLSKNYPACVRGLIRCAVSAALNQPFCAQRCGY
ncbi:hypothetical protein ACJD0Z_14050 [Flavobacteriaceae bacterium M23B6Z8]